MGAGGSVTPAEILERSQWDLFWLPDDVRAVDRPEVLYIASDRPDVIFNSVVRTRAAGAQLAAVVDEVRHAHPVRSRWLVPDTFDTTALEGELTVRGYVGDHTYDVRTLAVDAERPPLRDGLTVRRVQALEDLRAVYAVSRSAFGDGFPRSEADLRRELEACADPDGRVHRFVVFDEDRPVCAGGLNRYDDLGFGFLWAGGTVPEARGRGAYTALITARMQWARRLGLRLVGLYAKTDTSSPIAARQGFAHGGQMTYWDRSG
jgi:GNAT superfamily N-acetyltransferase